MTSNYKIIKAEYNDLPEILILQKKAFLPEAQFYNNFNTEPLIQTLQSIQDDFKNHLFLKAISEDKKIIGSVKGSETDKVCWISRLIVNPDYQNKGIGRKLISAIEKEFSAVNCYLLYTAADNIKNISLYESLGYKIHEELMDDHIPNLKWVLMIKENH